MSGTPVHEWNEMALERSPGSSFETLDEVQVMSRDRCVISHVNSACSATYSVHDSHVISA